MLAKYNEAFSDHHCPSDTSGCKGVSLKGIHLLDGLKSRLPWMISLETSMYSKKYNVIYSFPKTESTNLVNFSEKQVQCNQDILFPMFKEVTCHFINNWIHRLILQTAQYSRCCYTEKAVDSISHQRQPRAPQHVSFSYIPYVSTFLQ